MSLLKGVLLTLLVIAVLKGFRFIVVSYKSLPNLGSFHHTAAFFLSILLALVIAFITGCFGVAIYIYM